MLISLVPKLRLGMPSSEALLRTRTARPTPKLDRSKQSFEKVCSQAELGNKSKIHSLSLKPFGELGAANLQVGRRYGGCQSGALAAFVRPSIRSRQVPCRVPQDDYPEAWSHESRLALARFTASFADSASWQLALRWSRLANSRRTPRRATRVRPPLEGSPAIFFETVLQIENSLFCDATTYAQATYEQNPRKSAGLFWWAPKKSPPFFSAPKKPKKSPGGPGRAKGWPTNLHLALRGRIAIMSLPPLVYLHSHVRI